jgi:hypothetical protein
MTQEYYYLPASELQLATEEEAKVYLAKARAFVKSTKMYGSIEATAACAVAEYMAYEDDKTLREFRSDNV